MSIRTISLLILLLCATCWSANDFSGDPNCYSLWNVESGALGSDSKDSVTLSNQSTPDANGTFYKQGSYSLSSTAGYIAAGDASLPAAFPLKNGNTDLKFSICFWFYPTAFTSSSNQGLIDKDAAGARSFALYGSVATGKVALNLGSDAGATANVAHTWGTACTNGNWYWCSVTVQQNGANIDWTMYIWDDTNNQILGGGSAQSGSITNETWHLGTDDFKIGANTITASFFFDGYIDEIVVFDDVITSDERDSIRQGTFGSSAGAQIMPTVLTGD